MQQFRKNISGLGILFMILLKTPPLPQFSLFSKEVITESRAFSRKQTALQFSLN